VDLSAKDAFGEAATHKAARAQHVKAVQGMQQMGKGAADFASGNVDEDTANDLLADKSR
jgi:hypothetical protein